MSTNVYLQYFQRHPSSLDLCYLLRLHGSKGITATHIARQLDLAIQTVTNALKKLEEAKIIESRKVGRERIYYPTDSMTFSKAIDESFRLLQNRRIKGRHFPFQVLLAELAHELRTSAASNSESLEVQQDVSVSSELADIRCQFQIVRNGTPVNTTIISHIDTEDSVLSLLGRVFLVARAKVKGTITIVLLFSPKLTSFLSPRMTLHETIESIFRDFGDVQPSKAKERKEALKKINVIRDFADESTMLMPNFARKLAGEIWNLRHGTKA